MEVAAIIKIISALAQAGQALAPVVQGALSVASSSDAATIKAALAELQASSDALFGNVQAELRG